MKKDAAFISNMIKKNMIFFHGWIDSFSVVSRPMVREMLEPAIVIGQGFWILLLANQNIKMLHFQ